MESLPAAVSSSIRVRRRSRWPRPNGWVFRSWPSWTPTAIPPDRLSGPGNDDAIRAVRLITARIADAILEGRGTLSKDESEEAADASAEAEMVATAETEA